MKWRRPKFLDVFKLENAHTMLMVVACLHNFGLEYDGWIDMMRLLLTLNLINTKMMILKMTTTKKI